MGRGGKWSSIYASQAAARKELPCPRLESPATLSSDKLNTSSTNLVPQSLVHSSRCPKITVMGGTRSPIMPLWRSGLPSRDPLPAADPDDIGNPYLLVRSRACT